MKRGFIFMLIICSLGISVKGQSTLAGEVDNMRLSLTPPTGSVENVTIIIDNRAKDEDDHANPYPPTDNVLINFSKNSFSTLADDGTGEMNKMVRDTRPYNGRYAVDFPVYLKPKVAGEFKISFQVKPDINHAATIVRLIDKENPNAFINLLEAPYLFNAEVKEYADRFILRVYAACIFKKNISNGDWIDESNWIGNLIPGLDNDVKKNNCVIIPSESKAIISQDNLNVSVLLNSGELEIKNGASLTVTNGVKLVSTSELY